MKLHIFEPKYRIMISRALGSDRFFVVMQLSKVPLLQAHRAGTQQPQHQPQTEEMKSSPTATVPTVAVDDASNPAVDRDPSSSITTVTPVESKTAKVPQQVFGCLVYISNCRFFPDGRSSVRCRVMHRVRITNAAEEFNTFGLISAEVEEVVDVANPSSQGAEDAKTTNTTTTGEGEQSSASQSGLVYHTTTVEQQQQQQQQGSELADEVKHEQRQLGDRATIVEITTLLATFARVNRTTIAQLEQVHGPMPVHDIGQVSFWIFQLIRGQETLKEQGVNSLEPQYRLDIAAEMLTRANKARYFSMDGQSWAVVIVLLMAIVGHYNGSFD